MIPNLSWSVIVPIPQGQNFVVVNNAAVPFVPVGAKAWTESDDNVVIGATVDLTTLSQNGATFNLTGAPLDGNQVLIATFVGVNPAIPLPPAPVSPNYGGNVGSMLDRAIAAYLISQGAGTSDDVFPTWALSTKSYPNTVVKSHQFTHDPMNTGTEIWQLSIQFRQSAASNPKEPNPYYKRVEIDARIIATMTALLQTTDVNTQHVGYANNGQTFDAVAQAITVAGRALALPQDDSAQAQQLAKNNADMANFTCLHWYYRGGARGEPEEEGCAWVEMRNFEAVAAPSVIN